jgi:hypothetical protein
MASIEQVIKDLEEIRDTGGAGGGSRTSEDRRKAVAFAKEALKNSKEFNILDKRRIELEIKSLRIAQGLYKYDTDAYKNIAKEIKSKEKLIESNEKLVDVTKKIGTSFVGLGKAAFEGQGSISAFTDNVKGLGILGNRLDVNIETFRQLSQTGANFGKSIVDLRLAAGEAALPLDDFAKLVGDNSGNLAALFGSTTKGAKEIARLGAETRRLGIDRLAPLGFTVDEINETLLLNLDSQRRTGVLNRLTEGQRVKSAINFALELDKLAKLTGAQRQDLMNEIEAQKANERFQVALQGQTEETRQRLQGFAGAVSKAAPGLTEGIQDLIASGGRSITDASIELIQNIPQLRGVIQDLVSGTSGSGEALQAFSDLVPGSIERFRQATITGQVGFTRLQGPLLEFRDRMLDLNGVNDEQEAKVSSLVSNLTSFEQATKVLSSQFQGIETALLKSFGPALGGLVGGIQSAFGAGGFVAKALAGAPALTASLIGGALIGKVLFGPAVQVLTTAKGVAMGINMSKGGGMMSSLFGGKGKGPIGPNMPVKGGRFGAFARTGVGKSVGYAGLGMNALGAYSSLSDDDKTNDASGFGTIAGTAIGAGLGLLAGPGGALLGASLGGMAGGAIGGMFGGKRTLGTIGATGKSFEPNTGLLHVEKGETVLKQADAQAYNKFNTEALESKLNSTVSELNGANKTLTNMVNSVNTLVAVQSRALKAVETTARKDRNQVGTV